ncbi:hypothetical protein MMC13_007200 [Lambiella insularis]|nr:hypothetical protein [Lambiella insularis]
MNLLRNYIDQNKFTLLEVATMGVQTLLTKFELEELETLEKSLQEAWNKGIRNKLVVRMVDDLTRKLQDLSLSEIPGTESVDPSREENGAPQRIESHSRRRWEKTGRGSVRRRYKKSMFGKYFLSEL